MELNGQIENINISGILTDQSFPLQDEGNTQDLKDFDNAKLLPSSLELESLI